MTDQIKVASKGKKVDKSMAARFDFLPKHFFVYFRNLPRKKLKWGHLIDDVVRVQTILPATGRHSKSAILVAFLPG